MYNSGLIYCIVGISFSSVLGDDSTCDISAFPDSFLFGAGTSAFQIEGGWNEDGKGRSWWDFFMNEYPSWNGNVTGNIAADSYHRYEEDIAAMQKIGLDFYRFSLSWPRLLPKGFSYSVNQAGVDYYNNLINALIAANITPVVTIYHWDTPMALEHLGNTWTNRKMIDYFVDYADLAFRLFGDRVKLWATINEPKSFCQGIPSYAVYAFPELPIGTLEYLCGHHVLLAHAKAYRHYESTYKATQNGRVSITLDLNYNMPLTSNSTEDQEAAERRNQFDYGWFVHPLVYGDYPKIMKTTIANNSANQNFSSSRLPTFTCTEKLMIKGAYDLFLVNSYTANLVTMATYDNTPSYANDEQTTSTQASHWLATAINGMAAYPAGIRSVLKYIKDTYQNPEIIITENGYSDTGGTDDTLRVDFIRETLQHIRLAMCEDGVNLTGYTYWSLLDNLEWSRGYRPKFGLVQVDFENENRTRTLKTSAYYYKNIIATHYINSTSSE